MVGLEPTPNRLKADCSAIELHPHSCELLNLDLMQEPCGSQLGVLRSRDRGMTPYPRVELGTPSLGKTGLHPAGKGKK